MKLISRKNVFELSSKKACKNDKIIALGLGIEWNTYPSAELKEIIFHITFAKWQINIKLSKQSLEKFEIDFFNYMINDHP